MDGIESGGDPEEAKFAVSTIGPYIFTVKVLDAPAYVPPNAPVALH